MATLQNIFKRYELKYLISRDKRQKLETVLKFMTLPDEYGRSTVSNIYFDTADFRIIRGSLDGGIYKEKLRLRGYGDIKSTDNCFLELKKKFDGVVYKRRIVLPEKEAENYLLYDVPTSRETQILREIDYFKAFYGKIIPSMFICYDRTAYYGKNDRELRITFDENILYRTDDLSLTYGAYGKRIIPEKYSLLEIKISSAMPLWLCELLSRLEIYQTSFSKYGTAYQCEQAKNIREGILSA